MGLVAIVTYFLTSSRAKVNAAAFKTKVLRIVEILNDRIARLERARADAEAAQREAAENARVAEAQANVAAKDADDARTRAAAEQERADRAERLVQALEARIHEVKAEQASWTGEEAAAENLAGIAGSALGITSVLRLRTVVTSSAVLSAHRFRPDDALVELDRKIAVSESVAAREATQLDELSEDSANREMDLLLQLFLLSV